MHYVSADLLLVFLSNDFSSVLIVMQVVAVRLCFVDDAICCVYVETKSRLALSLMIQWCSNFSYLNLIRHSVTENGFKKESRNWGICTKTWQTALLTNAVKYEQKTTNTDLWCKLSNTSVLKKKKKKNHTSCILFH